MIENQGDYDLSGRVSIKPPHRSGSGSFLLLIENHIHAIAIHYMHYNFVRIHQSLRCTPAMAAGVSSKLWSIEDIVALLDNPQHCPDRVFWHASSAQVAFLSIFFQLFSATYGPLKS